MKYTSQKFLAILLTIFATACTDEPDNPLMADESASTILVMDMSKPVRFNPAPKGWFHRTFWFRPPMQLEFDRKEGIEALQCKTSASGSTFGRYTDIDLARTPILEWRWYVELPISSSLDERTREGDDHPARLYIEFADANDERHFMEIIWSNRALKPGDYKYIDEFPHYVANGGDENIGRWITEKVDLMKLYKETTKQSDKPRLKRIAIFCDSDDTGGKSIAYFGNISLKKREAD